MYFRSAVTCTKIYDSGIQRLDFKIVFDDIVGNSNTWRYSIFTGFSVFRTVVGVVPASFQPGKGKWIGYGGGIFTFEYFCIILGIGYISATGNKNNSSVSDIPYGSPYGEGFDCFVFIYFS